MKYKCINEFYIEIYDEDWMPTGEYRTIPAGTVWELDESTNNIGGEVHLDNDDEGWIEISRDTLEECFEGLSRKEGLNEAQEDISRDGDFPR